MWTAADKAISYDQVKSDAQHAKKDMKMVRLYMRDCTVKSAYNELIGTMKIRVLFH